MKIKIYKRALALLLSCKILLLTGCHSSVQNLLSEYQLDEEIKIVEVNNREYNPKDFELCKTNIIYSTDSNTSGNIYKDIDFIKELVAKYDVNTIYFDIDGINCSESLIRIFLDKCYCNKIFVGIIGSEDAYDEHDEYLSNCNCCLRINKNNKLNIQKQMYNSIYDEDQDKYYTKFDYKVVIENYDLNNPNNYINDVVYVVEEGDTLSEIGDIFSISYTTLMEYNEIEDSTIYPGQEIVIPNTYKKDLCEEKNIDEYVDSSYESVDTNIFYKGIDVSQFQGTIDWEKANNIVDFVILRIADSYNKDSDGNILLDSQFKRNIAYCNELGIPVGIYIYSRARTEEDINKEIKFVLDNIKDYNINLPIYRDLEGEYAQDLCNSYSDRENQVNLTIKFCESMENAGYPAGIYLHKKYIDKVPELKEYSIWAHGGYLYSSDMKFDNMKYAYNEPYNRFDLTSTVNIYQVSEKGYTTDLGINSEYVDLNYADKSFIDALIRRFDTKGNVKINRN